MTDEEVVVADDVASDDNEGVVVDASAQDEQRAVASDDDALPSELASNGSAGRCEALNRFGQPCGCSPRKGQKLCPWHHRTREGQMAAGLLRRRGGKNSRRALPPDLPLDAVPQYRDVAAIQGLIELSVAELRMLTNTETRARAIGSLATLLLKAVETVELAQLRMELDIVKENLSTRDEEPWRSNH